MARPLGSVASRTVGRTVGRGCLCWSPRAMSSPASPYRLPRALAPTMALLLLGSAHAPAAWRQLSELPIGSGAPMAYDVARRRVVFLASSYGTAPVSETWEWDDQRWRRQPTPTSPPVRSLHAMAYDAQRHKVVLFGGSAGG